MRTVIKNRDFTEIRKILYLRNNSIENTLFNAGSSAISDPNFLETDFKYFQDKIEFSSPDLLDYLVIGDKSNIIGGRRIEKSLVTLFPSLVKDSSGIGSTTFFSTYIDNRGTEILAVLVPEGIDTIKMYEEGSEVVETILLSFEGDEISFSKVIWLVTSYSEGSRAVNLSWTAYKGDKNPVKKMSDYVLRNDEFISDFSGLSYENGFVYSSISGSLVGTVKQEKRPIYNLLKGFAKDNWNKRVRYSLGDRVVVGGKTYESVEPNNIGNHPYYSRMWYLLA